MTSCNVLKELVCNGSNLILYKGISYEVLKELVTLARTSGSKITLTTKIDYDVVREISMIAGNTITFIDGHESVSCHPIGVSIKP